MRLTPEAVRTLKWLPPTCAYRLLSEGKDLPEWHPLITGDPDTVHLAGISVRGRISASEEDLTLDEIEKRVVRWPIKGSRRFRR